MGINSPDGGPAVAGGSGTHALTNTPKINTTIPLEAAGRNLIMELLRMGDTDVDTRIITVRIRVLQTVMILMRATNLVAPMVHRNRGQQTT